MRKFFGTSLLGLCLAVRLVLAAPAARQPDVDVHALAEQIKQVGPQGKNNPLAISAARKLSRADVSQIPDILRELKGANPLARNWLRGVLESIRGHAESEGEKIPFDQLEAFLLDVSQDPKARRLAYEWIIELDRSAADRFIPDMLNDASLELRRDAVARVLDDAASKKKQGDKGAALTTYKRALLAARDPDQVRSASSALAELGEKPDLAQHFGYMLHWKLVGPFDNTQKRGFSISYPPEKQIDFEAAYPGKQKEVKWIDHTTTHETARVDLNTTLGKHMGAVAYAAAEFYSNAAQPADLRLTSTNANKLWLNGELLHAAEIYHTGSGMDQYIGRGQLKPGKNIILVKICQNEQTEDWAQGWQFQLRVCDELGTAIHSTKQ